MDIDSDAQWRFEIAEGANAGAEIALAPGRYRLGSDPANDIVLADPQAQAAHLDLVVSTSGAALTALAGGVSLRQRALLAGSTKTLAPGTEIRVGGTLMRVHGPSRARGIAPAPAAIAGLCLLMVGVATATFIGSGASHRPAGARIAHAASPATIGAALVALRAHAAETPLAHMLRFARSDGAVLATGLVAPGSRPAWTALQSWFDGRFGRDVALIDNTQVAGADGAPPLGIAAISLLPVPNVVTTDGEHYTEGAVLRGGWVISTIGAGGVTLTRGAEKIEISS